MKKFVFIMLISIVLAIVATPFYLHYSEEDTYSTEESPFLSKENNPLLEAPSGVEEVGIKSIEEGVQVEPIPNATGEVVVEPIPNATGDFNVITLPSESKEAEEGFETIEKDSSVGGL